MPHLFKLDRITLFIPWLSATLISAIFAHFSCLLSDNLLHFLMVFSKNTKPVIILPYYLLIIYHLVDPSIIHHCIIHYLCKFTAENRVTIKLPWVAWFSLWKWKQNYSKQQGIPVNNIELYGRCRLLAVPGFFLILPYDWRKLRIDFVFIQKKSGHEKKVI